MKTCNRSACKAPETTPGTFLWNVETGAWYCLDCSARINASAFITLKRAICFREADIPDTAHYKP